MAKPKINKVAPPKVRLAKALKRNKLVAVKEPTPRLKKDGSSWTPWSEEVALRLEKKKERIAANGGVDDRTGKCTALTTGLHGPQRLCDKWAVKGCTVCGTHGASAKHVKDAAKQRLLDELDPTVSALIELRDQRDHMPTALGASAQILNRVLGKPDSVDKDKGAGTPIVRIGFALGGLPTGQNQLSVGLEVLPGKRTTTVVEADNDEDVVEGEVE